MLKFFATFAAITLVQCYNDDSTWLIPDDFLIGVASSAYQIEGAWNIDDKGISIWDHFTHKYPKKIADKSNGDIATDSYHKYKEDIALLANLGVNHYRFSLSWSRICPHGHADYVSQSAISYYHKIFDELEKNDIIPLVTIYHWDHPQSIQEKGGWLNENMPKWYADYARVVFENFGPRVKYFVTINEPLIYCLGGFRSGDYPPGLQLNGTGDYLCVHNQLKGHALAYHMYDKEFRERQGGQVGIVYHCKDYFSKGNSESEMLAFEFECGFQAHPVFSKTGDYPQIMKDKVAERSLAQGYKTSRMPVFTKQEIEFIRGSADFFGLNYYTSKVVKPLPRNNIVNWPNDEGLEYTVDPQWMLSQSSWLKVVPEGLERLLNLIKDKYDNPKVYITENGVTSARPRNDKSRISYITSHLKAILSAVDNGCDVKGYTYWSLLDSFEWDFGYTNQFGLIHVDFNDTSRPRTLKRSARWFKRLLSDREIY